MGIVVNFPARRRHGRTSGARASAGSRAASAAINSAVTPAFLTRGAASTRAHHSAGITSRWCHLRAAEADAPISSAMAPGERQSSMMDRNDVIASAMAESLLGQIVLDRKANLSLDCEELLGHPVPMELKSFDRKKFGQRLVQARGQRSTIAVADALGMDQSLYSKYENGKREMPLRRVVPFAFLCGVNVEWLITGVQRREAPEPKPKSRKNAA
jgi:hypothetical protein